MTAYVYTLYAKEHLSLCEEYCVVLILGPRICISVQQFVNLIIYYYHYLYIWNFKVHQYPHESDGILCQSSFRTLELNRHFCYAF